MNFPEIDKLRPQKKTDDADGDILEFIPKAT